MYKKKKWEQRQDLGTGNRKTNNKKLIKKT